MTSKFLRWMLGPLAVLLTLCVAWPAHANILVTNFFENAVDLYHDDGTPYPGHFIAPNSAGLYQPSGITVGPDNNIYVSSLGHVIAGPTEINSQILVYDRTGQPVGGGLYGDVGSSVRLASIAFGSNGFLYAASLPDFGSSPVFIFDGLTSSLSRIILPPFDFAPSAVTTDKDGNLYIANALQAGIYRVNAADLVNPSSYIDDLNPLTPLVLNPALLIPWAFDGSLIVPGGMVVGDDGAIYVANVFGNNVAKVSPDLNGSFLHDVSVLYTLDSGPFTIPPPPDSSFPSNAPSGIIFDKDGNLIVSMLGPSNPFDGIYPLGGLLKSGTSPGDPEALAFPIPSASSLALLDAVPEPSSISLGLLGAVGVGWVFFRRRRP